MSIKPTATTQPFVPAALAASRVGTWEYDVGADVFRCDATMAALYGVPAREGERGVRIAQIRAAIHPEDLPRHVAERQRIFREGGLFVIEYRTRPRADEVRWVLVRGCYDADATGRVVIGRGIAIDVTENKQDGYAVGRAHFSTSDLTADIPGSLERLADLALEARRVIDRIGGRTGAFLRPSVDALLLGIGRGIATRLQRSEDGEWGHDDTPPRRH